MIEKKQIEERFDKNKYTFLTHGITTLLVLAFLVMGWAFYSLLIEANPPVIIYSVAISPTVTTQGDTVIMTADFCKRTDAHSNFTSFWRREGDGLLWEIKSKEQNISEAGCFVTNVPLLVPDDIPDGMWQRVNNAEYRVNTIAVRGVTWESNFIEIR